MELSGYQLTEAIATSQRSVVWRGVRQDDGKQVVIKALAGEYPSLQQVRQLEFEYRILRKVDGPGVVQALALERKNGSSALVLEDYGGQNIPVQAGGLELSLFLDAAIQAAQALGRIHERGVIHKDIKPKNLLVNPSTREIKLVDFHLASELVRERQDGSATAQLWASLPYMSPEQTGRMNRELDYRTDYYSLGVTLFQLLTGRLPFEAEDAMEWVHCHVSRRAPKACEFRSEVPIVLSDIVGKLMAKDPDDRYQSAYGLITDLRTCQEKWGAQSTIEPFAIGARDVPERFQISQRLFGREEEIQKLVALFGRACSGAAQLVLVAGHSGVGKSSLIQEIHKSIAHKNGYFVSGKHEQLERNVPYAAVAQALRKLARQLLAESDERLARWRERLAEALGVSARLMVELIPELEEILGPQPPLPTSSPQEVQHRFKRGFQELFRVLSRAEHPLVMMLDDLQWLDTSSAELLSELFTSDGVGHLLVIGAYRENEVNEGHLLPLCVKEIQSERTSAVETLHLEPLREGAVSQLIAETLRAPEASVRSLSRLVFEKTEGNPFLLTELLNSLDLAGAFSFASTEGRWTWDIAKVRQAGVSEDMAELTIERLRNLPEEALSTLKIASALKSRFDLKTLAKIMGVAPARVAQTLWQPIVQRVIVPLDADYRLADMEGSEQSQESINSSYQFQHDRVQQATYSFISQEQRPEVHAHIGRTLLACADGLERETRIFDIVNHLNLGRDLLGESERSELVQLNARAARRAKDSAAYAISVRYLEAALELLDLAEGRTDQEVHFQLSSERAECVFLVGDVERAAVLCQGLHDLAPTPIARAAVYYLETRIVEHQGNLLEAVQTVRRGLQVLGVQLPEAHGEIDEKIGDGLGRMQAHLCAVPAEQLARLPEMEDAERIMTMNLLFQVIPPAIQTYPPLFVLAELMMFDLALTHGTTAASCKNFVDCGILQADILENHDVAYQLGQVAFDLLARYAPTPLESAVHFVFGAFISHWRAHYREGFEAYAKAERLGMELGDVQHVAYTIVHRMHRLLFVGRHLDECAAENATGIARLERARAAGQIRGALVSVRAVAKLRGSDEDRVAREQADQEAVAELDAGKNGQWCYSFGQAQAMVSFFLSETEEAQRWLEYTKPFLPAAASLFSVPDYHLFHALILLKRWPQLSEEGRAEARATIEQSLGKLTRWAECCPANFEHKLLLLQAEWARSEGGSVEEVQRLYDRAISAAEGFQHMRALAYELTGEFWLEKEHPKIGRMYLRDAHQAYAHWGATAKTAQLEKRHPGWFNVEERHEAQYVTNTTTGGSTGGVVLDVASVLKATQAIAGEVQSERLFARLMNTIIENAGAQKGCLVLKSEIDQKLYVEAAADVDAPVKMQSILLESAEAVCAEVVRYVVRSRDTVVLDDAAQQGAFQSEPYVRKHAVKSMLCMPLVYQGGLLGALYVENNAATRAFTKERLDILRVIASQAAIAITNSRVYGQLEQIVQKRTAELAQKSREVATMLDGMDQGIFTIDSDLKIHSEYSRYLETLLGTTQIAGRSCLDLLFADSDLRPDALTAMEAALRTSFGVQLFLAEANADHLVRECRRRNGEGSQRHFEVDWHFVLDDTGCVEKILVVVRDVTVLDQLREAAAFKARETEISSQILDVGIDVFEEFYRSAIRGVAEGRAEIGKAAGFSSEAIKLLFRNMHTIKGNARLLGFSQVVAVVHRAEQACVELRDQCIDLDAQAKSGSRNGELRDASCREIQLLEALGNVHKQLEEYQEVCQRKLMRLSSHKESIQQDVLQSIEQFVADEHAEPKEVLAKIQTLLAEHQGTALANIVVMTRRGLLVLAKHLGKSEPNIEVTGTPIGLSRKWALVMKDALGQCLTNCLAHGIEEDGMREQLGKPLPGRIELHAQWFEIHGQRCISIRLGDDGRGLWLEELRRKVGQPDASDEGVAESIFVSGVSTANEVSSISGRGVGMDAVRSAVRQAGGDVHIVFTGEELEGRRPFELVFTLPEEAATALGRL